MTPSILTRKRKLEIMKDDVQTRKRKLKSIFDDWVRSHPSAKGLYGKPSVHVDALVEIFAKDKANGKGATLPMDELEKIKLEAIGESMSVNASDPTPNSEETSKGKARKKARYAPSDVGVASGIHLMASSFSKFVDGPMLHFKSIQECMTQENEVNTQLFKELGKIEGLSDDDILEAASMNDASIMCLLVKNFLIRAVKNN